MWDGAEAMPTPDRVFLPVAVGRALDACERRAETALTEVNTKPWPGGEWPAAGSARRGIIVGPGA